METWTPKQQARAEGFSTQSDRAVLIARGKSRSSGCPPFFLIAEFLYDLSGNKLSSFDGSGNAVAEEIYAGGRHLATYLNSTNSTYFHHTDWLGSLRTDTGVSGASTQTCTGLPFGDGSSCTGTFSSANLFTDDFHDAEDNLEHTLFRKLSTTQGRWMTPDPSGIAAVDQTNPQTLSQKGKPKGDQPANSQPKGEAKREAKRGSQKGTSQKGSQKEAKREEAKRGQPELRDFLSACRMARRCRDALVVYCPELPAT